MQMLRQGETFPTALRVANAIRMVYVAGYDYTWQVMTKSHKCIRVSSPRTQILAAFLREHRLLPK